MPNRNTPPLVSIVGQLPSLVPELTKLPNQVPVYFLNGGSEGIIKIDLLFLAGSFNQSKPLVAYTMANMLNAGTSDKTSRQIAEQFEFYGTSLQIDTQKDIIIVSVTVLKKHLEPVLDLLGGVMNDPVFPEEEVNIFARNKKSQHLVSTRRIEYLARTHFNEKLFGSGHPYGYRLRSNDFDKVQAADLKEFYRSWIHPGNLKIIVSGNPPPEMEKLLERHYGDNKQVQKVLEPEKKEFQINNLKSQRFFINHKVSLQSAIRIGKRTISRKHPDFHRLVITNALLGGYFGSRLMRNIRQDKGFTYGIQSALVSLVRDGYFFVATQVGADVWKNALEQIYLELYNLGIKPTTADELDNLKNYLAGQYIRLFDGPFAMAERLRELLVFDLSHEHYTNFLTELKSITPGIIMETARKYLNENSMTEVVVGKR
ncbi:MAG TPA: pitrilysin family protein [Bacteroidales bacterium]|nr:pitrilysin family protein [Bacteroidales bacterium]